MSNYTLNNNLSSTVNPNVAYCNSWVPVENNAGRPLYAEASYITNLSDLVISLSSSNVDIGAVHIIDKDTGLAATIADVGAGLGAMRVLSQDLEPVHDTVSLGDVNGNLAYITLSGLNVYTINPVTAVSLTNQLTSTSVTVLNPVTAVGVFSLSTYVNLITSTQNTTNTLLKTVTANQSIAVNQVITNTFLDSITANQATAVNQTTTNTLLNTLTAQSLASNNLTNTNNTLLNSITANQATAVNQTTTNTLLNSVTANQSIQITLEKTLTANSVFGTSKSQPSNIVGIVQLSSINISDANWLFQVGMGRIQGAALKSFTGYSSAVGTTFQPMWEDGSYVFLNSAQQLTLKSTSNSDTDVSVFIDGLDSNYNPISETLILTNGTVGVTTVNSYYRINGISLTRTPMAVGRITLGNANILAYINIGTDRSAMTVFSVPSGYTFYLERVNAFCSFIVNTAGNNNIPINAYFRSNTVTNGLRNIILTSPFYSTYNSTRISPRGYPQKTDCVWECRSESDTYKPSIGLQIEGILISNSAL